MQTKNDLLKVHQLISILFTYEISQILYRANYSQQKHTQHAYNFSTFGWLIEQKK